MSLSTRLFRLTILAFSGLVPAICFAQGKPQFVQPEVQQTGGRVTGFVPGNFQTGLSGSPDLLYINASTTTGATYSVTAGTLLIDQNHAFTTLPENQITFPNTLSAAAAVADFDGDNRPDFAFALSPTTPGGTNLCVYHGTGFPVGVGISFGAYICTAFPVQPNAPLLPKFSYMVAAPFSTKQPLQQLFIEDTANDTIYVLANKGNLSGFAEAALIAIPPADGPGPIYTGDFNGDGNTDLIVNNQTSNVATLYFGNGDGTFQAPVRLAFDHNVHSLLLQDMDGDHVPDMVVEGDNGVIEIFKGNNTTINPFASISEGGTAAGLNGITGNGGHLAAIADVNGDGIPDILTTTPIGLSVLLGQGGLQYKLKGIYNIGPGRSIFSVADFNGDGHPDLYVDSPEGIAIVLGNGDGSFQTSLAYSAGQPALSATIADFNSDGRPDVAVTTGAVQAQILTGNGHGTFNTAPAPTSTPPNPSAIPANLWSTALTGDFDGDGCKDLLYSLTGLPLPQPGSTAGSGLYLQYGNKTSGKCDGTFQPPQPISNQAVGAPADNNFYGESAVGDFDGDGIDDIANLDTYYYATLLSQQGGGALKLGTTIREDANNSAESGELDSFSQVAAGFFKTGRANRQDLVFQDDANITPYLNNGDGTFTAMHALANPPAVGSFYGGAILIADIDGDGNGDIIIPYQNLGADPSNPSSNFVNQLYIWYGNGDGTFGQPVITPLSRNYSLAQVADMNNDGLPDIVLSDGYLVSILYNQGDRSFGTTIKGVFTPVEQHFLAGQGINSISVADVNGDGSLDLVLSNGGATISDAVAIGGKTLPSISLAPNPGVNTGGITVLLNQVLTKPVTGTLTASPNPSHYQSAFTLIATLIPTSTVLPTGTVTFSIDGVEVGSPVAVTSGATSSSASYTVSAGNTYQGGSHTLTAQYSGDAANSPLPLSGTHAINGSGTTTTLYLCIGPTPSCPSTGALTPPSPPYPTSLTMFYGQTFNGTTTAAANDGSTLDPMSTIAFNDSYNGGPSLTLCTLPVAVPSACDPSIGTTVGTFVGTNAFTAVYSGDANHTTSTSPTVTITVLPDTNTATLACAPNPSPQGQPVTCTATFTGNFAAPIGPVTFSNGSTPLCSNANLVPSTTSPVVSTATCITSILPVGTDTITASYAATLDFAAAATTTSETITPVLATTTKLTSSQNPSLVGQSVIFTATVSTATGVPVPTGTVTFFDGATTLGTAVLVNGAAAFTTTTLTAGTHAITATASGDAATGPSTSPPLIQIVNPLPPPGSVNFKITVTPSPITVGVGNAIAVNVTVTPLNGFSQPITLSCGSLPGESTCTFSNAVIPLSNGATQLLISTMAPHNCGGTQPYFTGSTTASPTSNLAPIAIPMLAGLAVIFLPGRRRWLRSLIATVAIATAMQITGCGNCTDLGTRPNTYTIQVVGAASGTAEVESTPVTLNVII